MIDMILRKAESKLPEKGEFPPFGVQFQLPVMSTKNMVMLMIEMIIRSESDGRVLRTMSVREGTDRLYNHFLLRGSSEDILEYLKDKKNLPVIYESLQELSDSIDKYWGD